MQYNYLQLFVKKENHTEFLNTTSLEAQTILRNSRMHPDFLEIYLEERHGITVSGTQYESLARCNDQALIAPYQLANSLYHKLKYSNYPRRKLKASLGAQTLAQLHHGIVFEKWVNPLIIQRLRGMEASNIVRFWQNFLDKFMPRIEMLRYFAWEEEDVSSNMDGSFQVIFYILPIGLGMALVEFAAMEVRSQIVRFGKGLYSRMKIVYYKAMLLLYLCRFADVIDEGD